MVDNKVEMYVKTVVGHTFTIKVNPKTDTGYTVKQQIQNSDKGPRASNQTLLFEGRELSNDKTLESENIVDAGTQLHLIVKEKGWCSIF